MAAPAPAPAAPTTVARTASYDEPRIVKVAPLDWPTSLETATIECVGQSYLDYEARRQNRHSFLHFSSFANRAGSDQNDEDEDAVRGVAANGTNGKKKKKEINLLTISSAKLKRLTYYQILGDIPLYSSSDQIKRAFHKACLKYHPDKTDTKDGADEDPVFLKVKEAFDTLSDITKRKSYDSTVDFDETIPTEGVVYTDNDEFYTVYGHVFERNLRFDSNNDPEKTHNGHSNALAKKTGIKNNKAKKNNGRKATGSANGGQQNDCPPFGNDDTPIEQVNAFYDYWAHFESWRDFTIKATAETEHDTDMAECREEKRWMEKEIMRKAKAMKREEMARINTLVERAMAADPRIRRERERELAEKEAKATARKEKAEKEEKERVEMEAKMRMEAAEKEAVEREANAKVKAVKEQEKKALRKARQLFRKLSMAAFRADTRNTWIDLDTMNDDIELLCAKLSLEEIESLSHALGCTDAAATLDQSPDIDALSDVKEYAENLKAGAAQRSVEELKKRKEMRAEAAAKAAQTKAAKASLPWVKEEVTALGKGVKKYPAGGANRWETIALFVNNLCKLKEPRTKEECIEKYNQIAANVVLRQDEGTTTTHNGTVGEDVVWTEEQDKQLQAALAKFPASMDKNERWTLIAKAVEKKTKKDCVGRFKAIREAIKSK